VLKFPLHAKQTERKDVNRIHPTQVTTQREGPTETIRTYGLAYLTGYTVPVGSVHKRQITQTC